jgi:hypothetical protein
LFGRTCHRFGGLLGLGSLVVEGEEAAEDFLAGGGADGVADAVVFGQRLYFVEIVVELEVLPTIRITDRFV